MSTQLAGDAQYLDFMQAGYDTAKQRRNDVTVYCFKFPKTTGRHHADQPEYYLMGLEQINQLRSREYGSSNHPDTSGGVLYLAQGQQVEIGRAPGSWLPGIGWDYPSLKEHDADLRTSYQSVSRHEAHASVEEDGQLLITRNQQGHAHHGLAMFVGVGRSKNLQGQAASAS